MEIHPQSIRGYAYLIKNELTGAGYSDDTKLAIHLIEAEMGIQYGMVYYAEDLKNARLGGLPDYGRFRSMKINLLPIEGEPDDSLKRRGDISPVLSLAGRPFITSLGTEQLKFSPCDFDWQLTARQSQTRKPVFIVSADGLHVLLTPEAVLVSQVVAWAVPANPFPADQDSEYYWKDEWNVPLHIREMVVDAVIRKMMPTYWQVKQMGQDKINNGND